jgi:hypothetical protein
VNPEPHVHRAAAPSRASARARTTTAAAALLAACGCAAHLPRADEPVAFLERSSVELSSDRRQAFEARPAIHLLLVNGLDDADAGATRHTAAVLSASFLGDFRVWRDTSAPVRAPTYEPRARLQLLRGATFGSSPGGARPHRLLGALSLDVGHRSNGEEGCALAEHLRDGGPSDFDCVATTDPPSDRLNVRDGSFTTNYVGGGLALRWVAGAGASVPAGTALTARGGAEWNVPCNLGACMPAAMRARYGAVRTGWELAAEVPLAGAPAWAARGLRVRAGAEGSVHLGTSGRGPWSEVSAELALMRAARGGLDGGLYVRRHFGRDYLNIRFEERLDAWTIGLVLDPAPPGAAARE